MSVMDRLKGLVGKGPEQAQAGAGTATSAAEEQTGGRHGDTPGQAGEQPRGGGDSPSEQDSPQQDGPGGGDRQ